MAVSRTSRGFAKVHSFVPGPGIARYMFASQFADSKVVVDIGCAGGCGTNLLARKSLMAIGADIEAESLSYAKEHYGGGKLNFIRLNAEKLPFSTNSIDMIVTHDMLEHLNKWEDFLNECQRALKGDGILVCSTPNAEIASRRSGTPLHPFHIKEFHIDEFGTILSERFKQVTLYGTDPQGRVDRLIYRFSVSTMPWLSFRLPRLVLLLLRLENLVTRYAWRRHQWLKTDDVDRMSEAELEEYLKRHQPYVLKNSFPLPQHIIGVATGKKIPVPN